MRHVQRDGHTQLWRMQQRHTLLFQGVPEDELAPAQARMQDLEDMVRQRSLPTAWHGPQHLLP